jgi:hypothetical protein
MSGLEAGDSEILQALREGDEDLPYTTEAILRVADWLVANGHAKPGYAERLRRALLREGQ